MANIHKNLVAKLQRASAQAGVPNRIDLVNAAHARWPEAFSFAGVKDHPRQHEFVKLLTAFMEQSTQGTPEQGKWGLNGKRGNVHDFSDDCVAYRGAGIAVDRAHNNEPMEIIDVIAVSGTPQARPAWQPGLAGPGDVGAWVAPDLSVLGGGSGGGTGGGETGAPAWEEKHRALLSQLPTGLTASQIAERFAASFPVEGWGAKKAAEGRPVSNDVIARKSSSGLWGYQVVPRSNSPQTFNLAGQVFVPVAGAQPGGGTGGGGGSGAQKDYERDFGGDATGALLMQTLMADYAAAGQGPNKGMGVWFWRTGFDALFKGLTMQQSIEKHRAEWLAELQR